MASIATATTIPRSRVATDSALHWLSIAASAWLLSGLFWDGWAHGYGLPDSFWTIWHAAFYSGYLAVAAVVGGAIAMRRGAIPAGYGWTTVGVVVFGIGGVFDAVWHTLFGIEVSTEALISPSHLVLATGIVLMVSGPLRAAWLRPGARTLTESLPAVLSLTAVFSLFTFMTMFGGAYSALIAQGATTSFGTMERQLVAVFFWSALLMGHVLVALRSGTLPVGSLTILIGVNGLAMILMRGHAPIEVQVAMIAVAFTAGIAGDALLWRLRPALDRPMQLRAFAFGLPAVYWALYLGTVALAFGTWWRVPALTGVPMLAGVVGLLISALVLPPTPRVVEPR
jgi:hypothetical protein